MELYATLLLQKTSYQEYDSNEKASAFDVQQVGVRLLGT